MTRSTALRIATVVALLSLSAFVALGCGGAKKGAGKAASKSSGLEYLPTSTVVYGVFDTDFDGDGWKTANRLASNFDGYTAFRDDLLDNLGDGDEDVEWSDIEPWLGDSAGFATLDLDSDAGYGWAELKDGGKARAFFEKQGYEKSGSEGDFDLYEGEDGTFIGLSDDLLLVANSEDDLKKLIKSKDGDSVLDSDGVEDAVDAIGDDALLAIVVNGDGLRTALEKSDNPAYEGSTGTSYVDAFEAAAFGMSADDEGFRASGFAGFDKEKLGDADLGSDFEPTLLEDLPADTVAAVTGQKLGEQIASMAKAVGDANDSASGGIAQVEGLLGVELSDLDEVFSGQFALALGAASDASGVPPVSFISETDDPDAADDVVGKLLGLSQMVTGAAPSTAQVDGGDVLQAKVGAFTITGGVNDERVIFSSAEDIFGGIGGDDTLGDSKTYTDAWKAAGAPDEVSYAAFFDVPAILKLAKSLGQSSSVDTDALGPVVAWANSDEDDISFDLFVQIES